MRKADSASQHIRARIPPTKAEHGKGVCTGEGGGRMGRSDTIREIQIFQFAIKSCIKHHVADSTASSDPKFCNMFVTYEFHGIVEFRVRPLHLALFKATLR